MPLSDRDPNTFSLPDQHIVRHIALSWKVDFDAKTVSGAATLTVEKLNPQNDTLLLDVSQLDIESVQLSGESLKYSVDETIKDIGSKLTIQLPKATATKFDIVISYKSSDSASGLQWLDPLQTMGRKEPYMFSQFQAIHARSVVPCQDTPEVKFTYEAEVSAPSRFTVLMSALRLKREKRGDQDVHFFKQPVPTPSYLIAIAVGMLESRQLGPRSSVWSEKEIIEKCVWEFANLDEMLRLSEQVCGPYVWGIYDILILPPSFPYGGMENPCLSFITPTLLAGDRSLVDVVVHEITHSWTGNLVTNRNFEHFWLNEGFTIFFERKISSLLSGVTNREKERDFQTILGLSDLSDTIDHLGKDNVLTNLVVNLKGLNPDDAFSTVPYEKGSTFLRYLENLLGGPEKFEPFLRHYLDTFQRRSIDTDDFKKLLQEYFKSNEAVNKIEWDKWLHTPGMPLHIPNYDDSYIKVCSDLVKRWITPGVNYADFTLADIKEMRSLQQVHFLTLLLKENISLELVEAMANAYKFDETNNAEIKCKWLRLCIKVRRADVVGPALRFVVDQGRMKYVRPIYRDLYGWEEARRRTIDNFLANEKYMMHVSAYTVRKDLHLSDA